MRLTRDIEDAALPRQRWSPAEIVTLCLFLIWCLLLLVCGLFFFYGILRAIVFAWRQWLDVCLWTGVSLISLILLGWCFYHFCRFVEFWCRPKIEETDT